MVGLDPTVHMRSVYVFGISVVDLWFSVLCGTISGKHKNYWISTMINGLMEVQLESGGMVMVNILLNCIQDLDFCTTGVSLA